MLQDKGTSLGEPGRTRAINPFSLERSLKFLSASSRSPGNKQKQVFQNLETLLPLQLQSTFKSRSQQAHAAKRPSGKGSSSCLFLAAGTNCKRKLKKKSSGRSLQ